MSFGKYLGGSPSNVAVAAARHGRRTGVITRTGDDAFGTYLHRELHKFGVDDPFVTPVKEWPTAVTFCAIKPPDDFPLYFYGRFPTAPDLQIKAEELDLDAIRKAGIFWSTVTGLCQEPSREAHLKAHEARPRTGLKDGQYTVLDLDYRPMFWASEEEARAEWPRSCRTSAWPSVTTRNAPSQWGREPRTSRPTGCWPPVWRSPW